LLSNVPAARLFDEFLKLFQSGFAEPTFKLLREHNLFGELFPATEQELSQDERYMAFTLSALKNSDQRVAEGKSVTPMFLLGVFLWLPVVKLAEIRRAEEKISESQALSVAAYEIVSQQQRRISIPKRFTVPMREMLALQPRFDNMRGKRAMNLLDHKRFRAAYDFMLLRSEVGEVPQEVAKFWTDVQSQSAETRAVSFQLHAGPGKKPSSRRRRRRKPKPDA
jgi:poly(A) polymerase